MCISVLLQPLGTLQVLQTKFEEAVQGGDTNAGLYLALQQLCIAQTPDPVVRLNYGQGSSSLPVRAQRFDMKPLLDEIEAVGRQWQHNQQQQQLREQQQKELRERGRMQQQQSSEHGHISSKDAMDTVGAD